MEIPRFGEYNHRHEFVLDLTNPPHFVLWREDSSALFLDTLKDIYYAEK